MLGPEAQWALITLTGALALVMALESRWGFRKAADNKQGTRWASNLGLSFGNFLLLALIAPWLSWWLSSLVFIEPAGFLRLGQYPVALAFLILLLSMQLVGYWFHRALHALPLLWRIHAVHHSDTEVDATTSHRHHFFEVLGSAVVNFPLMVLLQPDVTLLLGYNLLHIVLAVVQHGNISFGRIDALLRYLIITPDFHRVHHHCERQFTDSNYGTILPWFDYLFGTARRLSPEEQRTMCLGLNYFREPGFQRVDRLLAMPFSGVFSRTNTS